MKKNGIPQNSTGKKQVRIGQKVGKMVIIMQMVSVIFAVAMCVIMFRSLTTGMLEQRCTNGTNMLSYTLGLTSEEQDINALLDELKSRMGCEFTIFEGDTRAYTTVIQNGQRVVGTKLSADLNETVLQKGQPFVGTASILNEEYLCSYVPTRDASGAVNGLLFAGISSADANRQILITVLMSVLVSLIVIAVCVMIMARYLKKTVSYPLAEITRVAGRLEQGDLGLTAGEEIQITVRSNDEVGELADIFRETIHRLRSYIGEISEVLGAIAGGDLTASARQDYVGDFISIKRSMEDISSKLSDTMGQIRESASQVSAGSEQVSNSAQALAQGATEQASSVQELSATIGDISANAQLTAQATREAGQFVEQAGGQLGVSVEYVQQLNVAMEKISSSSVEISKIIATIENIAFQTNILALNAAVEAARAGSAGKGFAVVADEVRNLANRSDEAAKATKELIESSISAVTEGSGVVEQVTASLGRTSESAEGVTSKMSIVVDAVEKQTAALTQVTEGIDQISSVVQTNSATSEQSAAASQELSSQAALMRDLVAAFRLK
ncbi:MAG: methyl-accepting chemotaxis protein [Oscillibacter sp.]|jgi:methyl-accepting chemotaxis protein|nr:methyl-accepting chemotaxis protein [Oscillibacter sp.]